MEKCFGGTQLLYGTPIDFSDSSEKPIGEAYIPHAECLGSLPPLIHILPGIALPNAVLAIFDRLTLVADFGFTVFKRKSTVELRLDDEDVGLGIGIADFAVFHHPDESFCRVIGAVVVNEDIIERCFLAVYNDPFAFGGLLHRERGAGGLRTTSCGGEQ